MAYGLAGLVVLGAAGTLVGGAVFELGDVATRVGEQRDDLIATLHATSRTLHDASTGMGDVGTSLRTAHDATDHAAGLARSLGTTFDGLAAAMATPILGTRPLESLAGDFATSAGQAQQLATDLDQVSGVLAADSGDLETTRQDLAALADRFDALTGSLEDATIASGPPPVLIEIAFFGLLIWLAVPAAASLVLGLAILRRGRPDRSSVTLE